jgi:hypothetical protein
MVILRLRRNEPIFQEKKSLHMYTLPGIVFKESLQKRETRDLGEYDTRGEKKSDENDEGGR